MADFFSGYLFLTTAVTLFVIVDPPGLLPVFLGLTQKLDEGQRRSAATRASVVAFGVIALFALFGKVILEYLHVTVPAMQVAGGILLFLIALELLLDWGRKTASTHAGVNVAIVPLGTPLMAGPGAIVATIIAVQDAPFPVGHISVGLALVLVMGLVWVSLMFANVFKRLLRESGTMLASRIAGVLLSAIAVQMVADGVFGFVAQGR